MSGRSTSKSGRVTPSSISPEPVPKLEPTPALLEELRVASASLESAEPEEIIRWAADRFGDKLCMGTAFGPEGCSILEMLSRVAPATYVFNLETGYQFQETLDLRDLIAKRYGITVDYQSAAQTVEQYEAANGGPVYKTEPDRCCRERKLNVLNRAIVGHHAWISAIRRDQSPDRVKAPIVGWDAKFGLVKINPLANWTKQKVWARIMQRDVPYNPLHDQGYTSIGCWPCTRAVQLGEDERAGRWSGSAKTECGLHSLDESDD